MNRFFATIPLTLAAIVAASTANAGALAGTYSGSSADSNGVTVVVGTDAGGFLAALSETVFFSARCSDGSTLSTGWGYGTDQPITGSRVSNITAGPFFTIGYHLTFSADGQTATGTIASVGPTLSPVGPKPKKALFCRSKSQSVTLTRQPGPARVDPPMQGAVYLGKLVQSAY